MRRHQAQSHTHAPLAPWMGCGRDLTRSQCGGHSFQFSLTTNICSNNCFDRAWASSERQTDVALLTGSEMSPQVAAERRRQKALLRKFERALLASNVDALDDFLAEIDREFIWPDAMQRVAHLKQE